MKRTIRLFGTATRGQFATPGRLALMALMVAMSIIVFVGVTALSRASTDQLNSAITEEAGSVGTYRVSFGSDLGLGGPDLTRIVAAALKPLSERPVIVAEVLPPLPPECPPFEQMGTPVLKVARDASYTPIPQPFGENLPDGTEFCLAGLKVPRAALYSPASGERQLWGSGVVLLQADFSHQVALTTNQAITYEFLLITGHTDDLTAAIESSLHRGLDEAAARAAAGDYGHWTILRLDTSPQIRAAGNAVGIVYGLIGWGVLILGGLGVLVAQLVLLRDRTWFFGLTRALGASKRDVTFLVTAEVSLIVFYGTILAGTLMVALQPLLTHLGHTAFGVPLNVFEAFFSWDLLLGLGIVLGLGAGYPAFRAGRLDPVDILESR